MHREVEGIKEAMEFFKMEQGYILTLDQHDTIVIANKTIKVLPVYELSALFE